MTRNWSGKMLELVTKVLSIYVADNVMDNSKAFLYLTLQLCVNDVANTSF